MQANKQKAVSLGGEQTWPLWLWPQVERILELHFADRERPLASGGGKSISAVMIERCRIMGYRSIVCADCGGTGIGDESPRGAPDCKPCIGTGYVSWSEGAKCELPAEVCDCCNGSGRYWRKRHLVFAPRESVRDRRSGAVLLDYRGRPRLSKSRIVGSYANDTPKDSKHMACCVLCRGTGRREMLDAIPGPEAQSTPAQPDDSTAGNNANVAAVLKRLAESQPTALNALTLLYGEEGRRAIDAELGRNFAVWPLTKHGGWIARNGTGKTSYGRLIGAVRAQREDEANDLLTARLELTRSEAAGVEVHARRALFQADQQTKGSLLRQAEREAMGGGL